MTRADSNSETPNSADGTSRSGDGPTKTAKGQATRARILEVALRLFVDRGYDKTTMRLIAAETGVSIGNAYYYFASKENLIQAFYMRTHEEHLAACVDVLKHRRSFEGRLKAVLKAKIKTIEPYHQFSGVLFKTAADPRSPLNPFSDASLPTRAESTALFAEVIRGTKVDTTSDLWEELPNLLWIYHMGVVLFWIHDDSEDRRRTRMLLDTTVPLISKIVTLGNLPVLRSLTRKATTLLRDLRESRGLPTTSQALPGA